MKLGLVLAALLSLLAALSGCASFFSHREATFKKHGIEVGLETDPSTRQPSPPTSNDHPTRLTKAAITTLLRSLEVSGYSGTLAGIFVSPPRRPLFTETELGLISEPIVKTFLQAGPYERVFFSIPDPDKPYSSDRLEGALFIRGPYLHVIVTDHYAYLRADTASANNDKDPRDMKGMKLWVTRPGAPADLPPDRTPNWNPLETVHISLKIPEVLAARRTLPTQSESDSAGSPKSPAEPTAAADPEQDLRLQIRELTSSNLELRERLKEQARAMEDLKHELDRLRQELSSRPSKKDPPRQKPPSAQ